MTTTTLAGTNNNGHTVEVNFPFYKGSAGMQPRPDHIEFAYIGRAPGRGVMVGTIDGEVYVVLSAEKSAISRGIIVVKAVKQD